MIVVAAGIVRRQGRILLSQRKPGKQLGLKWEFPGGKLEKGESPQQALERELKEELGVDARAGRIFDVGFQADGDREILMLFFFCELIKGEPECLDCNALCWVKPGQLSGYDLAPADARVAARLDAEA